MLRSTKSRGRITQVHWNGGDADLTTASLLLRNEFGFYSATDIIFPITSVHGEGAVACHVNDIQQGPPMTSTRQRCR